VTEEKDVVDRHEREADEEPAERDGEACRVAAGVRRREESDASGVPRSITGQTQAAVAIERPARKAQDETKRGAPARARETKTPAEARDRHAAKRSAGGRRGSAARRSGLTDAVASVTTPHRTATAA